MSELQILFFGLAVGTWMIGNIGLLMLHYRRMGKSMWSVFSFFTFPANDFNATEWIITIAILVTTLTFGGIAISLYPQ